jgi:hypothetical protein
MDSFNCELMMFNMCKERDKYRTCVLPRCCNICEKRFDDCEYICVIYKQGTEESNVQNKVR